LFIVLIAIAATLSTAQAQRQTPVGGTSATTAAFFNQYCVTCHNPTAKTAGLVIDPTSLSNVPSHPELWEKVIRKLRSGTMPPSSAPRPAQTSYDAAAGFLETEVDRAAAAKPQAGFVAPLHRLTRTEFQNAVRDLLALEALPKEMDFSVLLPQDNVSSGFDNIADLLFVSPTTMERYLDAARKISRMAIGDPNMPLMVNIHRLSPEQWQDEQVEELPFGTRGGLAIRSYFPVDGEYNLKLELAGAARDPNEIDVTIDGERVQLIGIGGGGARGGRGGRGRGGGTGEPPMDFRIPIKAGSHLVGVTFVAHDQARDEETLRPRMRSRGTQPALGAVTITGPTNVRPGGDSPSRRRIFVCRPAAGATAVAETACARRILSTLARRAYRRPAIDADVDLLMPFYTAGRSEAGFDKGIQNALERLLVSPQFLFRIEHDPANNRAVPDRAYSITDLELASRLSFFIWSSIPDDELLDAAIAGKLRTTAGLDQQVRRMLADSRSESLVSNFASQWLYLNDIDAKEPDEILFPDFDETLRTALRKETDLFLDSILRENRSVLDLLTANYTFVNERLAKHYGIPNVQGSYFRRVTFPADNPRGGLLGQGSILTITSYANRTSPVLRGKWVLENLLAAAPPPPPPNVPALKTDAPEPGKTLAMRDAMTQHRANPACAGCHARMDPIGFAMENFDAVGKWRTRDSGNRIDASGEFPGGVRFDGPAGLKKALMEHPEQFVSAMTEKLLMYAIGRNLQYYDGPAVREIVRQAGRNNYTFASLVSGVVKSVPFQMREALGRGGTARQ
jgi:mono/diheme cytochrome c family protein